MAAKDGGLVLVCADLVGMEGTETAGKLFGDVDAIYDEAGMNSVPAYERERYCRALAEAVRPGAAGIVSTLEWTEVDTGGSKAEDCPPYACKPGEALAALTGAGFKVRLVSRKAKAFGAGGVGGFETVWAIKKKQ